VWACRVNPRSESGAALAGAEASTAGLAARSCTSGIDTVGPHPYTRRVLGWRALNVDWLVFLFIHLGASIRTLSEPEMGLGACGCPILMKGAAICQSAYKANTPLRSRREHKIVNEQLQSFS
jgi:hypothetical protein